MTESLSEKRGLLLLSGGFDSPVAGRMLQRLGCDIGAVHFDQQPFTDATGEEKARALAAQLGIKELFIASAGGPFSTFANQCHHRHYFVLMKRFMLRASERLARLHGYDFLITGESLGQVSSQTLPNLSTIDGAVQMPVVRPLLAFDKQEIIQIARDIGTHNISVGPEHCDALGPRYPSTHLQRADVEGDEAKVDYAALVAEAVRTVRRETPRALLTVTATGAPKC